MKKFNIIKKSRKKSKDIDEKIEYLDKECQKTNLQEFMTTSNVYQGSTKVPNQDYNNFNGLSHGGYGLGLSGGDGNGAGGGYVGTITLDMHLGHAYTGRTGVAISPPHPITGQRSYAKTQTGIGGFFEPLRPGTKQGNYGGSLRGGALWFFDPDYNFGGQVGRWLNFEWSPSQKAWCWYDTSAITGSLFLNPNLDQYQLRSVNIGTQIKNTIAAINFGDNGEVGTPQTTVLTKNDLDDPSFIPIDIGGLSKPGYDYLKNKATDEYLAGTYDLMKRGQVPFLTPDQVNKILVDPKYQQLLQDDPDILQQLQRMRAMADDGTKIASTDPSAAFPSAPTPPNPNATVEPSPPVPPDPSDAPYVSVDSTDDAKPNVKDAKLGTWMSRQDFMMTYPDSNMVDYLNSLPYQPSDFMTPNPNFPGAWDQNRQGYENYFMNGDLSALGNREGIPKPRNANTNIVPARYVAPVSASKPTGFLDAILSAGADAVGRGAAKDVFDYYMDKVEKGHNGGEHNINNLLGRSTRAIEKWYARNKTNLMVGRTGGTYGNTHFMVAQQDFQHLSSTDGNLKNITGTLDFNRGDGVFERGDTLEIIKHYDFNGERDLAGGGVVGNLGSKRYAKSKGIMKYLGDDGNGTSPLMKLVITIDQKTGTVKTSVKESLDESVKLGHFEPEALTVDLEKLRKGILPEFPKDPPPKLINGYSEKSKLLPKTIEGEPYIKVDKKELTKNHRLKDSEIKEFMDEVNMINEYIKNHPAELIHAMQRYPKHDPRLAQLNWQMDQKLKASEEYMETHFPENERLFNKLQAKIKMNIDQTDPKNFKGHKDAPKFVQNDISEQQRRRQVIARHFNKKKNKKSKQIKTDNLQEANWTPTTGSIANSTSQTFVYDVPNLETGEPNTFTASGLGGVESLPSSVKVDFGFNESPPGGVNPPSYNQLALAGYAKPILMKRRDPEEVNPKLDASQEFTKKIDAEVSMNARVEDSVDSALLSDIGYKSAEDILAEVGDVWTYEEYMEMMNAIGDRAAAKEDPIVKKILEYSPTGKNPGEVPISLIDAQEAITIAAHKAMDALARAWELYNKIPEPQDGFGGGQGNPTNRRGSGFDTQGALDDSGYGMDPSRDTETDARPVDDGDEGISSDDIKFLNKQQTLVNLTKGLGAIGLPNDFAQWTINYAKGDMTPITKFSKGMERQVRNLVLDKFKKNPGATTVDIQYGDYGYGFKALPTRLGLGRFNATKLSNGKIRIQDTFNVDKDFTTVGAADIVPGLQKTADRLVDISYKTRNIKGRTDEGGIKIDVLIDSGFVKKKKKKKVNESNTLSKIKKILKEKK